MKAKLMLIVLIFVITSLFPGVLASEESKADAALTNLYACKQYIRTPNSNLVFATEVWIYGEELYLRESKGMLSGKTELSKLGNHILDTLIPYSEHYQIEGKSYVRIEDGAHSTYDYWVESTPKSFEKLFPGIRRPVSLSLLDKDTDSRPAHRLSIQIGNDQIMDKILSYDVETGIILHQTNILDGKVVLIHYRPIGSKRCFK